MSQEQQQQYGDSTYNAEGMEATTKMAAVEGGMETKISNDKKLFVGRISWDMEPRDLKEYFSKYGDVTDVNIKTDPITGKCKGFGFITFSSAETVEAVLTNGPHTVKGKQIETNRAKAKPGIKKIFVGGLDPDVPEADIRAYFEKFGKIETMELPFDKMKNQRRKFCFIIFETDDAVDEACKQPRQKIGNNECDIKKMTGKPDPRSTRGRFGSGGNWSSPGGRGGRGGRGGGYRQNQGAQGYGGYGTSNQDYGSGYGASNQDYGTGYGTGNEYDSNNYSAWNYGQGGYGSGGYGQQKNDYGRAGRGGATTGGATGYHPYNR